MVFFSQRKKIEEMFYKWCEENHARFCINSFMVYLEINGMLNEEAIYRATMRQENKEEAGK